MGPIKNHQIRIYPFTRFAILKWINQQPTDFRDVPFLKRNHGDNVWVVGTIQPYSSIEYTYLRIEM